MNRSDHPRSQTREVEQSTGDPISSGVDPRFPKKASISFYITSRIIGPCKSDYRYTPGWCDPEGSDNLVVGKESGSYTGLRSFVAAVIDCANVYAEQKGKVSTNGPASNDFENIMEHVRSGGFTLTCKLDGTRGAEWKS